MANPWAAPQDAIAPSSFFQSTQGLKAHSPLEQVHSLARHPLAETALTKWRVDDVSQSENRSELTRQSGTIVEWEDKIRLTQSIAGVRSQAIAPPFPNSRLKRATVSDGLTGYPQQTALVGDMKADGLLKLPPLSGKYQVGTRTYSFTDAKRLEVFTPAPTDRRQVVFQVWYPTDSTAGAKRAPYLDRAIARAYDQEFSGGGAVTQALMSVRTNSFLNTDVSGDRSKYPVVLFSPGGFEIPQFYTSQAEQLASQGYVVATLASTYDSRYTLIPGQKPPVSTSLDLLQGAYNPDFNVARQTGELMSQVRAADLSFVLDKLTQLHRQDSLLAGHLNLKQVGVYGHSLGGSAAAEAMRRDARFKAGINYDGTVWTDVAQVGLTQPFMIMNNSTDGTADLTKQALFQNLQGDAYSLTIARTGHYNFSDQPLLQSLGLPFASIGTLRPRRGAAIVNDYTSAFFNQYLRGQKRPLLQGMGQPAQVQFQFRPAQSGVQ